MTFTVLDTALAYADMGVPVFPLRSNKRPCQKDGHKAATTDAAAIKRMFADPSAMLIGIPTGPEVGFDILDIDPRAGGDIWLREHEHEIPATHRSHTRSGGIHFRFKHMPGMGNSASRIAPGVDVRGAGGYAVAWEAHGFHSTGGEVADWPAWLLIPALRRVNPNTPAPDAEALAPPDAATLIALIEATPNPADATRDDYTAFNLAIQGAIRGLEALGREVDPAAIYDAAAEWSAKWDSPAASDFATERARWDDDWSARDRDISGWNHVVGMAGKFGADVSAYVLAAAVAEFPALPPEPKSSTPSGASGRPQVNVRVDNLTDQILAAENALISADLGIYQAAGGLVRIGEVTERSRIGAERRIVRRVEVDETHLRELMGRCADFMRWDARKLEWQITRCPAELPRMYLSRRSLDWRVPELVGIVTAPTLRADGSVLQAAGYDTATGLLFDPRGESFPAVADAPSPADARAALADISGLVSEFPFVDDASRAVALSAILTALVRRSLPAAPMHAFTAPTPGTGKSYLLEIVCRIATGQPAPGCDYSVDEAENRKQIDAALVAGSPLLILDNVDAEIRGARLNQILTQESVTVRMLGQTRNIEVRCGMFVLANGNNLVVAADMTRRTLLCRMDARVERPELREFSDNPIARIAADRGRFVAAALTVLRAYHVAGCPGRPKPLGSFEAWSDTVRGALLWLGEADPAATIEAVRENDPKRMDLLSVVEHWARVIQAKPVTALEVVHASLNDAEFREALLAVAGISGTVNTRRLGFWLRANKGKIVNGMKLLPDGTARVGSVMWRLDGAPELASADAIDLAAERARRVATPAATTADFAALS